MTGNDQANPNAGDPESKDIAPQDALRALILKERDNGNVVFRGLPDTLMTAPLDDFVKQPADGILYDLNRSEEISLTFLDDPKWVNDFAVALVIRKLHAQLSAALLRAEAAEKLMGEKRHASFLLGQESVRRRNQSGCCCDLGEDGETVTSVCALHEEWAKGLREAAEKDARRKALEEAARIIDALTLDRKPDDKRDPEDELFFEFCAGGAKAIRAAIKAG